MFRAQLPLTMDSIPWRHTAQLKSPLPLREGGLYTQQRQPGTCPRTELLKQEPYKGVGVVLKILRRHQEAQTGTIADIRINSEEDLSKQDTLKILEKMADRCSTNILKF